MDQGGGSGSREKQVCSDYNLKVEGSLLRTGWCLSLACTIKWGIRVTSPSQQCLPKHLQTCGCPRKPTAWLNLLEIPGHILSLLGHPGQSLRESRMWSTKQGSRLGCIVLLWSMPGSWTSVSSQGLREGGEGQSLPQPTRSRYDLVRSLHFSEILSSPFRTRGNNSDFVRRA